MVPISIARLTAIYLRVGSFTFGGGDPTMAALQTELVRNRGWLSAEQYTLAYVLARLTPGTNMLAFVAGSAWELAGWTAAVLGVLATSVPSAVLTLALTAGYESLTTNPRAMAAIAGTLAAAVGMMATGAWQLVSAHLLSGNWRRVSRAIVFAASALLLSYRYDVSPIQVLAMAGLAGLVWQSSAQA